MGNSRTRFAIPGFRQYAKPFTLVTLQECLEAGKYNADNR
jgi:hypothetical protein